MKYMQFNELVKELNKDLKGKKLSFLELDNYMMVQGFYSVYNDGVEEQVKKDKNVVYTLINNAAKEVIIYFDIIKTFSNNNFDFSIKIISIEEF